MPRPALLCRPSFVCWSLLALILVALPLFAAKPPTSKAAATPSAPTTVELLADRPLLGPASTLEFRFPQPMVSADQVGLEATPPPIILTPAVPGRFTWLSRRSGVFVADGPWPLGAKLEVTLRPGLAAAAPTVGEAVPPPLPEFHETLATPPFGLLSPAEHSGAEGDELNTSTPETALLFNSPVDLASAVPLFRYLDGEGHQVAAKVRHPSAAEIRSSSGEEASQLDWVSRWKLARNDVSVTPAKAESLSEEEEKALVPHALFVTPAEPLLPGSWHLEGKAGLRSADGADQITEPSQIPLGELPPFALKKIEVQPVEGARRERRVLVEFGRPVEPDLTPELLAKYFQLEPALPGVRLEKSWDGVSFTGLFQPGETYHLRIDPALLSEEGLPVSGELALEVKIAPLSAELQPLEVSEFALHTTDGALELQVNNLASVTITTQLLATKDELAAWMSTVDAPEQSGERPETLAFKGPVVFQETIPIEGEWDAAQIVKRPWEALFKGRRFGTLAVTVTGQARAHGEGDATPPEAGALKRMALVSRTDLGVLWRKMGDRLQVEVTSRTDGRPVPKAQVQSLDDRGQPIQRVVTNAEGVASLPLGPKQNWLLVVAGEDRHLSLPGGEASSLLPVHRHWLYDDDWSGKSAKAPPKVYPYYFSDRPLYRPGETIHVKGYLRIQREGRLELAPALPLQVSLLNQAGETVFTRAVTSDARGSLALDLPIGLVPRGSYHLHFAHREDAARLAYTDDLAIEIADFQADAFRLSLDLPENFAAGTPTAAEVTGEYFFGAPLQGAKLHWTLRTQAIEFAPKDFLRWNFCEPGTDEEPVAKIITFSGDAPLNPTAVIKPGATAPVATPERAVLTAEVTDLNGQTVTEARTFLRQANDFYLGYQFTGSSAHPAGQPLPVNVIAVTPKGQPFPGAVPFQAEVRDLSIIYTREPIAGTPRFCFTRHQEKKVVATLEGRTLVPVWKDEAWEAAEDAASIKLPALPAGPYELRLTARDLDDRLVVTTGRFDVAASEEAPRPDDEDRRDHGALTLTPDKGVYQPGETAHVKIEPPFTGVAEVSIERGSRVVRTVAVKLEKENPTFDLALTEEDAPGVEISLLEVRSRADLTAPPHKPAAHFGEATLKVKTPMHDLRVTISPTRSDWRPGEEVDVTVQVKDALGQPTEGADVTFFAVDEGVLALHEYTAPDPAARYADLAFSIIRTGLSLLPCWPPQGPDDDGTSKSMVASTDNALAQPGRKPRQDFAATATWLPNLPTDAEGKIHLRFRAPDALTKYRLTAVAQFEADRFGVTESAITVRQPVTILPGLGQIGWIGDQLLARATVRNDTGAAGQLEVELALDATAEVTPAGTPLKSSCPLAAGESKAVEFPLRLVAEGEAHWQWQATLTNAAGAREADRVVSTLQIASPAPLLRETYLSEGKGPTSELLAGVNPQVLEGAGSLTVNLSNSRLASLREASRYVMAYPYGCGEQTISALLPWVLRPQLSAFLPVLAAEKQPEEVLRAGVQKIFALQGPEGGLGLWPTSRQPSLFVSAYAALLCSMLPAECPPPAERQERLLAYLTTAVTQPVNAENEHALGERALACWALAAAGEPAPEANAELFRQRALLSRESRALLALALLDTGGAEKQIRPLLDPSAAAPAAVSWYGGAARERALQVLAWVKYQPRAAELGPLVAELVKLQRNGHWGTTQDDAWALLALARYYSIAEGKPVEFAGLLTGFGPNKPFTITKEQPSFTHTISFNAKALTQLTAHTRPPTAPYFRELQWLARASVAAQPAQDRGFAISRQYEKLLPDGTLQPTGELHPGDRILVSLRVEITQPAHFVAIDDPLPSILEAINPNFQTKAGPTDPANPAETRETSDRYVDHREIRAERVLFFCDHLPTGAHHFTYLARVRNAGTTSAPPAKVEEMYHPERFGLSTPSPLKAK